MTYANDMATKEQVRTNAGLASELRFSVMRLRRRLVRERHPDNDLSLSAMAVLWGLHRHGDLTVGALASREQVRPPSMTRTVNCLAEDGLVTREPHPTDGRQVVAGEGAADLALSDHFGEEVELAPEADIAHQDAGQVSLVGTATLRELGTLCGLDEPVDPRHLRANLVVETAEPFEEEGWLGREVRVGDVVLRVVERIERCRMVDLQQVGLPALEGLLKVVGAERDLCAGVYADVVQPGVLAEGDELTA